MPTAGSSTDAASPVGVGAGFVAETRRAVADVGHLVRFRTASLRRRRAGVVALAAFVVVTLGAAVAPAFVPGAGAGSGRALDLLLLLPTMLTGFLALTIVSATASGGGRELLARDPAAVHPISPTTDHLGALLLAPLNIAWLLQAWALLAVTAFALGPKLYLAQAQVVVVLWLGAATAIAQVLAWILEGVRRVPHGIVGIRALTVGVLGATLGLQISGRLLQVFDELPTRWVVVGMVSDSVGRWALTVGVVLAMLVGAVVLGAVPAHIAAHRIPQDELDVESGHHPVRRLARSAWGQLVRTDRASVWRAVPMRRGVAVLALAPGLVALAGNLPWAQLTVLPGLVASGGALLWGVNAWCLDGRGGLWRESLPVPPETVFDARAWVLGEFLLAASLVTVLLGAVRAGVPSVAELTALVCTLVVVTLQVVAASLRWSDQRPFAVDLRSARATPAPPVVMVGYSARLALSTTVTGLVFSGLANVDAWQVSVLVAVPFLAWSTARLLRTRRAWGEPVGRARVITAVAV
ncbi:hypothetical protein [Nocardioides sp.]|uniref:hypothetical protein n=1 Tax=Nocardioides sp. TaxID=35761 RepID=UPI00286AA6F7|nr:hypothetical protein [Nocardioides sp.]